MKPDFYIDCRVPGDNPIIRPDPEPIDNDCEVQVFRLNPDGSKGELLRIEPAFPEGWHHPQQFREKGFQKKKEDKAKMARYYWKALWPQAQELLAQGLSTAKVAEKLGIDAPALRCKIDRERRKAERQTPEPEPAAAANQEPEQEEVGSATQSVAQEEPEITVKDVLMCEAAQREQGFGPEDDEPIPYQVAEDATLDEMKVIWIENVLTHCTQAKTQLQYIQAIMDLRV
jgi:hypothetical protein